MEFNHSPCDIAFINGKVITVNEDDEIAEAVGVAANKIIFVGSDAEIEDIITRETRVIDLKGRTLMPGIIDSHYHPILSGLLGTEPDSAIIDTFMDNCKSLKDLFQILKAAVAIREKGEWISMMGYEPLLLPERRHPTIDELDELAPENPVHCMHGGGHICMYNTKALEYLDVHRPEDAKKYPPNEVEVINGKLTGMVRGHTHFNLWEKVKYTEEQQKKAAMKAQRDLVENGITSIHDCGECGKASYHVMQQLCRERAFKVRTYMMLHSIFGKTYSLKDNECFMNLGLMTGLGDEYFRIGACKFMIDGGSGGPSCLTREPYTHDPSLPRESGWTREEVADYIALINNAECQATAHAIGDLAIEYMVEGYEKAFAQNPRPDLRHRIEHCMITDRDLIDRMAELNICPSVNAGMLQKLGANYTEFYGERMKYAVALRSMIDAGVMVSIHSDSPSGPSGIAVIDGAVNRYDRIKDFQCDRTQEISVTEAIRLTTYNAAYASFEEEIKGSIEPGKLADMIVLSDDILSVPKEEIYKLNVEMTMIDGEIVYRHSSR